MIFLYYLIFSYSLTVSINDQIFSGSSFDNILNQYGDDVSTIQTLIIIDGSFKLSSISNKFTQLSTLKIPKKSFIGDVPEYFLPNMNSLTNINIEGAKIFRRYSFQNCQSLQSVSSESCSIIGSYAFSNCKSLTSINFPILEEINPYAFENTALTKVELNTVSKIYAHSNNDDFSNIFSGCTKLTHVSLKNAVIIQGYMFYNCAQLIDINAPKVTKIGRNAFIGCQLLNNLNFPSLKTIGKGSFSGLNIIHVNLPTVTIIQESAFESCSSLQTASFESCTILYYYAFRNCKRLTSIISPILEEIYASVFENTALIDIKLDTVSKVQTEYSNYNCRHFKGCSKLTHVSMKSVSIIGRYMFENCYQLQNINFPSCTTIDLNGFLQCKNIKIMTIGYQTVKFTEIPNPSFLTNISFPNAISIDKNALSDCKNIVYCDLPNVVNTIEPNIFSNLEKLVELRIPKVTELKENSFIGCYNLKTISLESLTKIDSNSNNIFKGCMNLKIIYFPESPPKTFHKDTFKNINCKIVIPVDSISIYDNDISIEDDKENDGFWCGLILPSQYEQFTIIIQNGKKYSGTQLSDFILDSNIPESMIISLKIENGIVQIDLLIELLKKMVNLEEFVISDFVTIKGDLIDGIFNDFSFSSVIIDCFIEKIPSNCFKGCIKLKTIKIKNCKIVEDSAFSGCSNLECATLNVENLIGDSHFEGCISLISVSLTSLKTVDSNAKKIFYDCPLTSLYLPPQPPSTFNKDTFVGKNVVLLGLTNEELTNYDINTNVEDDVANDQKWCGIDLIQIYIKVSINDNENIIINSFSNLDTSNIKKIRINGGMIKKSIFEEINHINSLKHLFIDEASVLESYIIDEELFKNLKNIQYISIMHDISLTKNCFSGFSSLVSANFKSVTQLGDSCFKDCISLEKLTIPHCNRLEGDSHFENCVKLREINLTSLKFVDNSAENIFKGCNKLEKVALPSIEPCSFNKNSFKDCSNITLILPFLEDYIEYDDNLHVDGDEIGDNKWCGISFAEYKKRRKYFKYISF